MATLTGNSVGTSYLGLLKTTDNAAIGATEKNLTDGAGNASTLSIGTASASFTGTLDLAGATVTGLPGGAPGMVAGTQPNSIVSAAFLTATPATSDAQAGIAIGNNARTIGGGGFDRTNISIGSGLAGNERTVAIGHLVSSTGSRSVAIGENANTAQARAITMGQSSSVGNFSGVCVGSYSRANGERAVALGGYNTRADGQFSVCIGPEAESTLAQGNAIGYQVVALWEAATTVNRLAMKDVANLNYADQAAAVTAGVPVGGVYHTDGTLKIVY